VSKQTIPAVIGCCTGAVLGPVLLYGMVTTAKYIDGQVLDRGKYLHSTVVLEWADAVHKNNQSGLKQFYGAHIYTVKRSSGLDVYCQIHIGSPDYNHNCGHLGRVDDLQTARTFWGRLEWTTDALIVGDPNTNGTRVPRAEFQNHR
jgi:hypothetical protein